MDSVSSKISNKAIVKLTITTLILAIINTGFYWFNDHIILSGDPAHPHNPPFDNLGIRMLTREVSIWLFYLLNLFALKINSIHSQNKLLLITTLGLDIITILLALVRLLTDNPILYSSYNTLLGFLNSNIFFTILVILHYVALNQKAKSPQQSTE